MKPSQKLHLLREMMRETKAEALAASKAASLSPAPTSADLLDHVYRETADGSAASRQGRYFFNDEP